MCDSFTRGGWEISSRNKFGWKKLGEGFLRNISIFYNDFKKKSAPLCRNFDKGKISKNSTKLFSFFKDSYNFFTHFFSERIWVIRCFSPCNVYCIWLSYRRKPRIIYNPVFFLLQFFFNFSTKHKNTASNITAPRGPWNLVPNKKPVGFMYCSF